MRAIMFEFSAALRNATREGGRELDIETVCYSVEAMAYYNWHYGTKVLSKLDRDLVLDTLGLCTTGSGHFINDCERMDCRNV